MGSLNSTKLLGAFAVEEGIATKRHKKIEGLL
jgi:hypothetical protein